MPKRTDTNNEEGGKYRDVADLTFLPEEYLKKVNDIFDTYFGLGMVRHYKIYKEELPNFPNKVSALSSPDLGDIHLTFAAWHSFALDKLKYISVANSVIEGEIDRIEDSNLATLVTDKGNIDAKKAWARSQPNYVTILSYKQKISSLKEMLEKEVQKYDKAVSSLSREISRRESNAGF